VGVGMGVGADAYKLQLTANRIINIRPVDEYGALLWNILSSL
jgi:hypothetical protein